MPAGLKASANPIQISASVTETAGGTFTAEQIELTLNALDNEVFVVTQINLDVDSPDAPTGTGESTFNSASLSTVKRTTVGTIADSNVLAAAQRQIEVVTNAAGTSAYLTFDREDPIFSALDMDYLGIVATNNMHLNIQQEGNVAAGSPRSARVRVYGYRATATAAVYAALVQSELLSE